MSEKDIVAELRAIGVKICDEAADEIGQLARDKDHARAMIDVWQGRARRAEARAAEMRERIEQLEGALRVIAGCSDRLIALQAAQALDNIGADA